MNQPQPFPYPQPPPKKSNTGLVIGCVVGGIFLFFLAGIVLVSFFYFTARARRAASFSTSSTSVGMTSTPAIATGTPYTDTFGRFAVTFPSGSVSVKSDVEPTAVGPITTHIDQVLSGDVSYTASWSDLPMKPTNQDKTLDDAVAGSTKAGTLLRSSPITVSGLRGRELEASITSSGIKMRLVGRTFLSGPRLYQLNVVVPDYDYAKNKANADAFLLSFATTTP